MPDQVSAVPAAPRVEPIRQGWVRRWASHCRRAAADLLCPPQCQFCGADMAEREGDVLLCATCVAVLAPRRESTCLRCAAPVPLGSETKPDCPRCTNTQFHFSSVAALGVYHRELGDAVRRTKQPLHEPLAVALGRLMAREVTSRWPDFRPDILIPIPMYWGRRWLRGHNGPELIADAASNGLSTPVATDALICRRHHQRQATLSRAERFTNVRGVFAASRGYALAGTTILLIDDTMTTGATASEAARMLKRAGVAEVRVAVAARSIGVD